MLPDEERTRSSGPPPFTDPRRSRRPTVPITVTGYFVSIRPELECASSANAGAPASSIVTLPDDDESCQSEVCSPCTRSVPLDVDARKPPRSPVSWMEPELDDASTGPPPDCETWMLPLPVFTVTPPLTLTPSIEPLPALATNDPPTMSARIEPEPVDARTSPPASRIRIDPEPALVVMPPRRPSMRCEPEPVFEISVVSAGTTSV